MTDGMQCHQFLLTSNTRQQWPGIARVKLPKTKDHHVLCMPIMVK